MVLTILCLTNQYQVLMAQAHRSRVGTWIQVLEAAENCSILHVMNQGKP